MVALQEPYSFQVFVTKSCVFEKDFLGLGPFLSIAGDTARHTVAYLVAS